MTNSLLPTTMLAETGSDPLPLFGYFFVYAYERGFSMKTVRILLNSIDKVKTLVNELGKYDSDFDLTSGRYVIDAKSMMGIFSLDLSRPLDLYIHSDKDAPAILEVLAPYIVKE